jgi:hypothetical protein
MARKSKTGCRSGGCRKQGVRKGRLCAAHFKEVSQPHVPAPHVPAPRVPRPRFPCNSLDGFCRNFVISEKLTKTAETIFVVPQPLPKMMGRRHIVLLQRHHFECVRAILEELVRGNESVFSHLGKLTQELTPRLVIAPPMSRRQLHNQVGSAKLHRDVSTDLPGYLSFLLCVTRVTEDNGSVSFYPDTQAVPLDDRHAERSVQHREPKILTGSKGTCWLFDSRLLHQSNANMTEETRLTVNCLLWTADVQEPTIEV